MPFPRLSYRLSTGYLFSAYSSAYIEELFRRPKVYIDFIICEKASRIQLYGLSVGIDGQARLRKSGLTSY